MGCIFFFEINTCQIKFIYFNGIIILSISDRLRFIALSNPEICHDLVSAANKIDDQDSLISSLESKNSSFDLEVEINRSSFQKSIIINRK